MLIIRNLNLISVQSWTYLETEIKASREWPINVIEKTPCISLDCKLVPVLYREYVNSPFRTDSSVDKSFHAASILNQCGRWISLSFTERAARWTRETYRRWIIKTAWVYQPQTFWVIRPRFVFYKINFSFYMYKVSFFLLKCKCPYKFALAFSSLSCLSMSSHYSNFR